MKQSLIIILFICFVLGGSFAVIVKQDQKAGLKPSGICCNKSCDQQQQPARKNTTDQTLLPGVHLLPYSL